MDSWISVLVIEDEEHIRQILKYNLELEGFKVKLAENGKEGLEMAHEEPHPSVILLDRMMPKMDGLEVLQAIREDYETEKIPVIMLTAMGKIGDIDDAYDLGADGYITKPFDPAIIGQQIKKKLKECIPNRQKKWKKPESSEDKPKPTEIKKNKENLVK